MTTRQRIARLVPLLKKFPGLGATSARELEQWIALEFGSLDALETWKKYGPSQTRAVAPKTIYHVLAGNLAVSGQHSVLCGLLLGAHNVVKLPSRSGEDLICFIEMLPAPLRELVTVQTEFNVETLKSADAVIAFGRDETVAEIRAQTRWDQLFLGYGLQVSVIWLGAVKKVTPALVAAVAHDICIYDQMGCLSPQAIFLEPGSKTEAFGEALTEAMTKEIARLPKVERSAEEFGVIFETIDTARGLGQRVWTARSATIATAGAVILDPKPQFRFSCLHRVIRLHEVKATQLPQALDVVRGKISTLGLAGELTPALEKVLLPLGVKRFCRVGRMQHPPISWHHDGRPSLADLIRWVDQG